MPAFEAKWALIARPTESLPFLRLRLGCDNVEERSVAEITERLADRDPAVRAKAAAELVHCGSAAAVAVLERMSAADAPPEVCARLQTIMRTFIAP
jgi:hypothetical protein